MRQGSFEFSGKWRKKLFFLPETGMGYTVATIILKNGHVFQQVLISSGAITRVRNLPDIPFSEDDILELKATHQKWDWDETP